MHPTQKPATTSAPAVDITPADIQRAAALYLELHGWTQGDYYADPSDVTPFPPACATGAIGMACYGRVTTNPAANHEFEATRLYTRAVDSFADYLLCTEYTDLDHRFGDITLPFDFNDDPARTAEQVITALRAAADAYERTHHVDPIDDDVTYDEPLTDTGGYLSCGCHGSQRDHTCGPVD